MASIADRAFSVSEILLRMDNRDASSRITFAFACNTANGSTRSEGLSLKDVDRINDELPTEGGGPSSPDGGIVENPLG